MSEFEKSDMGSRCMGDGTPTGSHGLIDYVGYVRPSEDEAQLLLDLLSLFCEVCGSDMFESLLSRLTACGALLGRSWGGLEADWGPGKRTESTKEHDWYVENGRQM